MLTALFKPWSLARRQRSLSGRSALALGVVCCLLAACLSALLSTWTYLLGKGLLLGGDAMDMGRDDLPANTARQVVLGLGGSVLTWVLMLAVAVTICLAVADVLYRNNRAAWRTAATRTGAMSVWFIVWAVLILASNSVRQGETRHPAASIRAYAQLSQRWFRGTSVDNPGPIEREPLVAHGRVRALAVGFPIIWSLVLPPLSQTRFNRARLIGSAIVLSWLAWAAMWRLMPWSAIDAFAG